MHNAGTFLLFTMCLFAVVLLTRILPFMFSRVLKNSVTLAVVGKYLPPYIMMLLVLFEIKVPQFFVKPYNLPAMLALLVLIPVHWRWRKLTLSLLVSVGVFAVASYFVG